MALESGIHDSSQIEISVVICAYNEERTIGPLVLALLDQGRTSAPLREIICVASGCTDSTVSILHSIHDDHPIVRVVVQPERLGKASALNEGLKLVTGNVIVIESADTFPSGNFLSSISAPFRDPTVGIVCSRPVPTNSEGGLAVALGLILWEVHDEVSLRLPNAGEAMAIRGPSFPIPADVADDDAYVGFLARQRGGRAIYAREAVVLNRVPGTFSEYVRQRFRIHRQSISLLRRELYRTSTKNPRYALPAIARVLRRCPRRIIEIALFTFLELEVRALASLIAFVDRSDLRVWAPIKSTKLPIRSGKE